ncbi:MAG: hypothetical protein R3C53_14475 [Pirellulaceae bacterium]
MNPILPCPACNQITVLPPVSNQATIQCPHCHEQFVIQEILEALKTWEVIEDPEPQQISVAETPEVPQPVAATERTAESVVDELELAAEEPTKKQTDWSRFQPINHEKYERMRRKAKSPLWSVLQVALGGLAAIPISLLLIWHLIGTDIAGAGPAVGRYIPWIVPEKFRPLKDPLAQNGSAQPAAPTPAAASGLPSLQMPVAENPEGSTGVEENPSDVTVDPTLAATPGDTVPTDADSANSTPSVEPMPSAARVNTSAPTSQPSADVGTDNVFDVIHVTESHLADWSAAVQAGSTDLKPLALQVYEDLIKISEQMSALPVGNPIRRTARDKLRGIGRAVAEQADVQQVVKQGSKYWANNHQQASRYAWATIVEVNAANQHTDGQWLVEPAQLQHVDIVIPQELAASIEPQAVLLILGELEKGLATEAAPTRSRFTANYYQQISPR